MPTVNLGRVKPIYRGNYLGSFPYQPLDFVRYGSILYVCKAASTGNLPTNTAFFDVVTDIGAELPAANTVPKARSDGTIDLRWLGEKAAAVLNSGGAAVNDIGTPGGIGFGQGIAPETPTGYTALPGTFTLGSAEYGNYRYSDGSIMVWVPAFYYRYSHASNPTYATYGVNSVDIKPFSAFSSVADANAQGYALHRAFYDGGIVLGFMKDKYGCSNNAGTASSLKNGNPLSSNSAHNPFSGLTGAPPNTYAGAIAAAKTRGAQFFPASRFQIGALALISLAHAQASRNTSVCAWFDPAGVTNFPKGNNNNALGDVDDPTVSFTHDGFTGGNSAKTGSGVPFAKTTHNGQDCGIADLNGNMFSINLGMTCIAQSKNITAIGKTNPVSLTVAGHTIPNGSQVLIQGVAGTTELNDRIFEITVVGPDTISLNGVNGSSFNEYVSGGTVTFGQFYATKTSVRLDAYTGGNTLATDHWGATGVAATMDPINVPMRADYPNNGIAQRFGNGANAVLPGATNGSDWILACLALPIAAGTSLNGSNFFGQDLFYRYIRNESVVISCMGWAYSNQTGLNSCDLAGSRSSSLAAAGLRCASYPIR